MAARDTFWTRRLRWRLIGAWRWPLFVLFTFADAAIVHLLPFTGREALFFPALFVCSFVNLFLIGAIAPWLAGRMAARQGIPPASAPSTFPPADHREVLVDRIASAILVLTAIGLIIAGLGNRKVVVADTDRLEHAGAAVRAYVNAHAPPEIKQRVDAANTHPTQEDGFFRICVPYDDARKQYCMFVDANKQPPRVVPDHDTRPNETYFRTP